MKKGKLQKIIFIFILMLLVTNILGNIVLASDNNVTVVNELAEEEGWLDVFDSPINLLDGIAAIISTVFGLIVLLPVMGIQNILTGVAKLGGTTGTTGLLTPDDIFFNRLKLTDINFFEMNTGAEAIDTIRLNIATWYYSLRILAMVILLAVLIYVGIKMAISTVASDQAQYKKMLVNWAVSFALIFLLNYIIIFAIEVNDALVELLKGSVKVKIGDGITTQLIDNYITSAKTATTWASLILYCMLVGQTVAFFVNYVKRMLTIGFLIIISPLITVTYSIDKMGDGKAQALNTWLKEFIFNVLIQPFHCIIYAVFVSPALSLSATGGSISKLVLPVLCMQFIWKAEKIIREIFGFGQASSLGETVASMAAVKEIGKLASKIVGGGAKVVSKTKFGQNVANKVSNTRVGQAANKIKNTANRMADTTIGRIASGVVKTGASVAAGIGAASFEARIEFTCKCSTCRSNYSWNRT